MREIKFNVWDIENKRMLRDCFRLVNTGFLRWVQLDSASNNLIWLEYTGLKDKHGKEIFEGDILKFITTDCDGTESDMIYKVIFKDGMFKAKIIKSTIYKKNVELYTIYNEESVIIGNVYQNPDLISNK